MNSLDIMRIIPELPLTSKFYKRGYLQNVPLRGKGLYFIYNEKKQILYIGQTQNLRQRLQTHFSGNTHVLHHKEFYYFKFHEISDPFEREIYETYYISKLHPKYNRAKNKKGISEEVSVSTKNINRNHNSSIFNNIKSITTLNKLIEKYPDVWKKHIINKMNQL